MSVLRKLKDFIAEKSDEGSGWNFIYYRLKYGMASVLNVIWSQEHYARWFYHLYSGKTLNLEDPQTFNDKGWWLKLYNRDPLMTKCSDKYLARDYVRECGYEDILIPQYEVLKSVKELDFSKYNEPVIAKCNHNSGGHLFYDPAQPKTEKEMKRAKKNLAFILKQNAYILSREWNYKNIPRRIVVEKVIKDSKGRLPSDFRFFCFDGVPKLLMMDIGVIDDQGQHQAFFPRNIYDMDFNLLPIRWGRDNYEGEVEKPENFERMIEIAAKLSQPFPTCRVDLYNLDGKIYFGELTFYHGGCCQNITPEEWDYKIAEWVDLNSPKIVKEEK